MLEIFMLVAALAAPPSNACAIAFVAGRAPQAPPVAMMWAGYGTLRNTSDHAVTIASVSSPDFANAQIHETREEGGVERMRRIDPLLVPAGADIALAPGGKHLMLMRPTRSLDTAPTILVEFHVDGCSAAVVASLQVVRDPKS